MTPPIPTQFDTVLARESDVDIEVEHPLDGTLLASISNLHANLKANVGRPHSGPGSCHIPDS